MALLKFKRSAVPAKIPSIADLDLGELAINTYDGKVYTKKDDGTQSIVEVGGTASTTNTILLPVRNNTGATLTKGTAVYINGALGQNPTVTKAIATSDATSAQTLGLVSIDLPNNTVGNVTLIGSLDDVDTSAYTDGAQLYLSPTTAGALTATKPYAPNHLVYIAVVEYAHPTHGKLFVKVQNGYEMDELHDVSAQNPANNDGLFYNTTSGLWEKKSIATALGFTPASTSGPTFNNGVTVNNGSNQVQIAYDGNIEIIRAGGGAYIDLKDSTGEDFDIRLQASGNQLNIAAAGGLTLNGAGVLTGITSGQVTTALGYTPANRAGDTFTGSVTIPELFVSDNTPTFTSSAFQYHLHQSPHVAYVKQTGGYSWYWRRNSTGTLSGTSEVEDMSLTEDGNLNVRSEMRAPIFRDSLNTAYFVDPNGTSNLNNLTLNTGPVYRSDWTTRFQSGSDFVDGTLVTTDIVATGFAGDSFVIEITGKSYSATNLPFKVVAQGYLYNDTIINYTGISYGGDFATYIKVFEEGGVLKFWWPRISYWNSFNVNVMAMDGPTNNTITRNRVTAISNSTEPTGTKKQQINLARFMRGDVSATNSVDIRAPIFYDSPNTAYSIDPSGDSFLNTLYLRNGSGITTKAAYTSNFGYSSSYRTLVLGNEYLTTISMGVDVSGNASGSFNGQGEGREVLFRNNVGFITPNAANNSYLNVMQLTDGTANFTAYATAGGSFRAPLFYDTPDTSWFLDPSSTSVLNVVRANAIEHVNGTDAITLTDGSYVYFRSPDNGIRMYLGGADPANYYDNTTHFFRNRASTIQAQLNDSGGFLVGPNTSGQYTRLGGNGGAADVCTVSASNGNLHVDAKTGNNLYLSWYNVATTYVGGEIAATVFRDRDNAAYFIDPTATQSIRTVGDWRSDSSDWTGEFNGKIQYHANNWYFQAANEWIFRRSDGQSAMWVTQAGAASFFGPISTINNVFPPNGAIRLTPNMHLNAGTGSAVILNWDNGTTSGLTFRVGNGAGTDVFTVTAGGNATSYSYQGNGNVGGTGSASWHPSGIYSAGYNWLYGGISAGGGDISSVNNYYGNAYYDSGDTSTYVNPNGVSWIKGDINISRVATGGDNDCFGGLELREVSLVSNTQSAATYAPRVNFHWGNRAAATIYMDAGGSFVFGGQSNITSNRRSIFCNELYATGNVTAYYSDDRLKTRKGNIENALDIVSSLNGFRYVDNDLAKTFGYANEGGQIGVSAQEVQKHLPEIVRPAAFDVDHDNPDHGSKTGENYLTVDYSRLVPLLIEAIKELRGEVETLKNRS